MPHELRPPLTTSTPTWESLTPDSDLTQAAREHQTVETWLDALASLGEATIQDNQDDQLYDQAPDALRQRSTAPTADAIEAWVEEQRGKRT